MGVGRCETFAFSFFKCFVQRFRIADIFVRKVRQSIVSKCVNLEMKLCLQTDLNGVCLFLQQPLCLFQLNYTM